MVLIKGTRHTLPTRSSQLKGPNFTYKHLDFHQLLPNDQLSFLFCRYKLPMLDVELKCFRFAVKQRPMEVSVELYFLTILRHSFLLNLKQIERIFAS